MKYLQISRPYVLYACIVVIVALISIYFVFISPRPYYVTNSDAETDYYYNAKLIHRGFPPAMSLHPGVVIYSLYAQLLKISGDDIAHAQTFFSLSHLVAAFFNIAALLFFAEKILARRSFGVAFFSIASLIALPPFLSYLDYTASDAFILAFVLPTLTLFWHAIKNNDTSWKIVFLLAFGSGLCFALKSNLLLVIVPLCLAWSVFLFLRSGHTFVTYKKLSAFLGIGATSFLYFIAPAYQQLTEVANNILHRPELRVGLISTLANGLWNMVLSIGASPFIGFVIAGSLVMLVWTVWHVISSFVWRDKKINEEKMFWWPATVFLVMAAGLLIYSASFWARDFLIAQLKPGIHSYYDRGIAVRWSYQSFLILPFIFDYAYLFFKKSGWLESRAVNVVLLFCGSALILSSIIPYARFRENFLAYTSQEVVAIDKEITRQLPVKNAYFAWYTSNPNALYPMASFHLWGNHRYTYNTFDDEVIKISPRGTFFHYRELERLLYARRDTSPPNILQRIARAYKAVIPLQYDHKTYLFTGEDRKHLPRAIVFPESEREIGIDKEEQVLKFLSFYTGQKLKRKQFSVGKNIYTMYYGK